MSDNVNYKRVSNRAEASRKAAHSALDAMPGDTTWARVSALQAQAQIDALHLISYDLAEIRGALEN